MDIGGAVGSFWGRYVLSCKAHHPRQLGLRFILGFAVAANFAASSRLHPRLLGDPACAVLFSCPYPMAQDQSYR
jgi:hypothetical protein